jgi:protein-S-isoprenylcysteine O-methyltransferase Ste14
VKTHRPPTPTTDETATAASGHPSLPGDREDGSVTPRRLGRIGGNILGAAFAGYLLLPNLQFFAHTHRPIGLIFTIQQAWVAVIFLVRRAPRTVSRRPLHWFAAYAGWFTTFLIRPTGYHPALGVQVGFWVQLVGLISWGWALSKLARSYGVVPADRGLVTGGPYRIVRHPLYASYFVSGVGYLMQSVSVWNVVVDVVAVAWQIVRIRAEEAHLTSPAYAAYRARVRWRLIPGVW